MLSRRAMLSGLSAAVVTGGAGVGIVGVDRILHATGLRHSPDKHVPVSGWEVTEHRFASAAMGHEVEWAMSTPPSEPVGVVVCLHGRGGDHHFALNEVRIHDVAASVDAPLVVAAVDGGDHSYWHQRTDGTDALSMLLDEFIPAIDSAIGLTLPRAILGWSMGGYGALLAAERSPSMFVAVVAASPALWLAPGESANGAFDDAQDFQRFNVFTDIDKLDGLAVRVDCGTSDGFVNNARLFAAKLPTPNLGAFSRGYHDSRYWRSIAPGQIRTIRSAITA